MLHLLLAWALLLVGACYSPDIAEGLACSETQQCPLSQVCHHGQCLRDAPPADASSQGLAADAASTPPLADASVEEDAQWISCPTGLPTDFGDLGMADATKNNLGGHLNVFVDLGGDSRWLLAMYLYPGRGIFANGVLPGTYVLSADDLDVQTCAACLSLFADNEVEPTLHMFPMGATLVISSVTGSNVSGRIEEVVFSGIAINYDGEMCSGTEDPQCVNTLCLGGKCGQQHELAGCTTAVSAMKF